MSPTVDEVFHFCKLGDAIVNCSEVMQKSLTSQGICFTFNMLNPRDMFFDRSFYCPALNYIQIKSLIKTLSNSLGQDDINPNPPSSSNATSISNWDIHSGYPDALPTSTYPRRTFGSGLMVENRFQFLLRAGIPAKLCDSPSYTYRYFVHAPFESPEFLNKAHFVLARFSSLTILNMIPRVINSDESLRALPPIR